MPTELISAHQNDNALRVTFLQNKQFISILSETLALDLEDTRFTLVTKALKNLDHIPFRRSDLQQSKVRRSTMILQFVTYERLVYIFQNRGW